MNSEFVPQPSSLPPEAPGKKKIDEVKFPEQSEEVDGNKWTRNLQPPLNSPLTESDQLAQLKQEVAGASNIIAEGIVNADLNMRTPLETEMPAGVVSKSLLNKPNGTETIGEFGQIEQRTYDEEVNRRGYGQAGTPGIGTAFVEPGAFASNMEPQTQLAPPPPPPPRSDVPNIVAGDNVTNWDETVSKKNSFGGQHTTKLVSEYDNVFPPIGNLEPGKQDY